MADSKALHLRHVPAFGPDDGSASGGNSEIESLVSAISTSHMVPHAPSTSPRPVPRRPRPQKVRPPSEGKFEVEDSVFPIRPLKVGEASVEPPIVSDRRRQQQARAHRINSQPLQPHNQKCHQLRILIVEVRPMSCVFSCNPDGECRTIQSMPRCSKSVSSLTAIK